MAWYSRFLNLFRERSTSPSSKELARESFPRLDPRVVGTELGMYKHHPTIAMMTDLVSQEAAKVKLQARNRTEDGWIEIVDHPAVALISDPNPIITRFELLANTLSSVLTFGNAYWYLAGRGGAPEEIWFLPAPQMRVEPDPKTYLKGYAYEFRGKWQAFHHFEVVHFRRPSIDDYWYGSGVWLPAKDTVVADWAAGRHTRSFFEGGAVPAGSWSVPADVSDEDFKEIKQQIEELQRGVRRTPVTRQGADGEGLRFDSAGANHKEAEYTETRKFFRQQLLESGRVPSGILSETSTEAHARVSERFLANYIHTLLSMVQETLTKDFLPFWGGDVLEFEDVRTVDAQQVLWRRQSMEGLLDRDEMRWLLFGREPYEGDLLNDAVGERREIESEVRAESD